MEDYWTDSKYDPEKQEAIEVKALSPAYFELLSANKELGTFVALGNQLILVLDDETVLKISAEEGSEKLTAGEIAKLGRQIARQSGVSGSW